MQSNIIKTDLFGKKISKKQIKKDVLAESKERGKQGENNARMKLALQGYEVERKHKGEDFIARKRDIFTGKVTQTKHIEVKTGKAKLSKQQRMKKGKGNYVVMRESGGFW